MLLIMTQGRADIEKGIGKKSPKILSEKDEANSLLFIFPYFSQKDKCLCYILTKVMNEITLLFFSLKNEYIYIGNLKWKKINVNTCFVSNS